jgi:fatty acid desaturase
MPARELTRAEWCGLHGAVDPRSGRGLTLLIGVLDLGLVVGALALGLRAEFWYRVCAVPPLGLALLHAYLLHHECAHGALFRDDRLNRALGHVLGVALLYPFLPRRRAHLTHHRFTADVRDPANRRAIARFATLSPQAFWWLDWLWRGWFPFLVLNERIGLWCASLTMSAGDAALDAERRASLAYLTLYVSTLALLPFHPQLLGLLLVYACALWVVLWLEELINLPHHLEAPLSTRDSPLSLWKQHTVSASCRNVPLWSRWCLLHFNLHAAHHLFPRLPWHALPRVQGELIKLGVHTTLEHELRWNWQQRKRPFREAFVAYLAGE